jgi:cap1 methyltransferase
MKVAAIPREALHVARAESDPYSGIGKSLFMNRAAVKLANLDSLFNLTKVNSSSFLFADVCGGPGGFTEYVLWRTTRQRRYKNVRGWGITLKGVQDYDFSNMIVPPEDNFVPMYGQDGTGDIYKLENIKQFVKRVLNNTGRKVQLCMCDGGFSTAGDELHQEAHLTHLLIAQILIILIITERGGSAVIKIFDILLPVTVEVLFLAHLFFESMTIVKPFSSRPGNSEKYVVLKNRNVTVPASVIHHLEKCIQEYSNLKMSQESPVSSHDDNQPGFIPHSVKVSLGLNDLLHILPLELVSEDFVDYIRTVNMRYLV